MDAEKVVWDLLEEDIIDGGNLRIITDTKDTIQQNKILHLHLKQKCTVEALKIVCAVIINGERQPKDESTG